MKMTIDISNLADYEENNRIEVKRAKGGLPNSIWDTYSSFANTDGGVIILGVEERDDHTLAVTGVDDVHKLETDFWNMVNNRQKVNINLLTNRMVTSERIDGKDIIVIRVPRADRRYKPVFVGNDPMKGTYRRNFEGDYLCTTDEVAAMYRDASDVSIDQRVLKTMDISAIDMDTLHRYRNRFRLFHPIHAWNDEDDEVFLRRIGAIAICEDDMKFHPTSAGLLMFGREYDIVCEFHDYFLDYQERYDKETRWTDRFVSSSGDWSGNLYDFFFRVYPRITADLPVPFVAEGKDRIDETVLHLALREVLLNICAHSDHYGRQGIVIIKTKKSIEFSNPGDMRVGLQTALSGGVSDPRNATIMKMFSLVNIGERAGTGIPNLMHTWEKYVNEKPTFRITHNPERTQLIVPYSNILLNKAAELLTRRESSSQSPFGSLSETKELTERQRVIVNFISNVSQTDSNVSPNEMINETLTIASMSKALAISEATLKRELAFLQKTGIIKRERGRKNGFWIKL